MSPLLESLEARFATLPADVLGDAPLQAARRQALADAVESGLPGPRNERWKYTALRAFERRRFDAANDVEPAIDPAVVAAIPAPRIVFVNGRHATALSQLDGLPDGVAVGSLADALVRGDADAGRVLARRFERSDEAFARLNSALAADGMLLQVAAGARVDAPLHLVFIGTPLEGDAAWATASSIVLGRDSALTIVEQHISTAPHAHFANSRVDVSIGDGAQLLHARLQDDATTATQILRTDATLAAGARYHRLDLELGAALSRHELNVDLAGAGAELVANGVQLADGRRHVDTRLGIAHRVGNTSSTMLWRGLGADRGRAVFHGGIVIDAGADGSAAELSNKNLLLSLDAEIDTQPVLEIHADEVRAAHGATVGQLDPTALFYLRSRGLPADDARRLLTLAFCREPLSLVADAALAAWLTARLDARLHARDAQ